jgi:hypothetical protein
MEEHGMAELANWLPMEEHGMAELANWGRVMAELVLGQGPGGARAPVAGGRNGGKKTARL